MKVIIEHPSGTRVTRYGVQDFQTESNTPTDDNNVGEDERAIRLFYPVDSPEEYKREVVIRGEISSVCSGDSLPEDDIAAEVEWIHMADDFIDLDFGPNPESLPMYSELDELADEFDFDKSVIESFHDSPNFDYSIVINRFLDGVYWDAECGSHVQFKQSDDGTVQAVNAFDGEIENSYTSEYLWSNYHLFTDISSNVVQNPSEHAESVIDECAKIMDISDHDDRFALQAIKIFTREDVEYRKEL